MEDGWMRTLKPASIPARTNKDPARTPLPGLSEIHRAEGRGHGPLTPHLAPSAVFGKQNGTNAAQDPRPCHQRAQRAAELGQAEVREQANNVQDPKAKEIKETHQHRSSSFLVFTWHRRWGHESSRRSSGGSAAGRGVPGPKRAAPIP